MSENLTILEQYDSLSPSELEEKSEEALDWFRESLRNIRLSPTTLQDEGVLLKQAQPLIGMMVMFTYDAKTKKKLPYWDKFPVAIIVDVDEGNDTFLAMNLHYIQPLQRVQFLSELFELVRDYGEEDGVEDIFAKRLFITYDFLKTSSRMKYFRPCLKRYIGGRIGRGIRVVPYKYWDVAAMLPSQQWVGATGNTVYADSRRIIANA